MSAARVLGRPRSRAARLVRTVGAPQTNGAEAVEVVASVGGVILGALLGDVFADRAIRGPAVESESIVQTDLERRLVRIENDAKVRMIEERRSSYVVIGSILGGILAPFAARAVMERRR